MRGTLALLVLLGAAASAAPQSPPADVQPVILSGRIVAADNDAALRRVRVAVTISSGRVDPVFTDDDGRFTLTLPSRVSLTLTASKAGYAALMMPVPAPAIGRELDLRLPRGAAIVGRIVDAAGSPVAEVAVAARSVGGAARGQQFSTTTDDLGEYRLGGLSAGRYELLFGVNRSALDDIVPTSNGFAAVAGTARPAPPAAQASGQTIDVTAGDTVAAADIRLPPPLTAAERRALMLGQGASSRSLCPGPGTVRVRVVTSAGEAVSGATVRLSARTETTMSVGTETTAANGVAVFDCLRAAEYVIEVAMRARTIERYGDRRALRMAVTLRDGEAIDAPPVVVRSAPAVIGMVVDEHGEPLEGVTVKPLEVRHANGRTMAMPAGRERRTDDRGQFRLYGVEPGTYLLSASVDVTGTADIASSGELRVDAGRDADGVTIVFTPSPSARVSGIARDSAGNPVLGRVQLLVSQRSGAIAREPIETRTAGDGAFVVPNVPPGEYVVHAIRPAGLGLRTEVGSAYVSVTRGDPPLVTITTSDGSNLAGRLMVEDPERRPLTGLSLTAFPVDFDRAPLPQEGKGIVLQGDGTFYFTAVHGPTRIAITTAPDDWYLKSVRIGGVDATDASVDPGGNDVDDVAIVISTAGASLTGRTTDARRIDDYAVIVFSVNRELWGAHSRHMKLTPSSADGTFRVSGLPPGDYWAAALDPADARIDNGAWQDPVFLERLSSLALRVTLAEGERRTVTLRLTFSPPRTPASAPSDPADRRSAHR